MIHTWPEDAEPERLTFISDLHLFSSRSNAGQYESLIEESVDWSDLCVWGGDLFDFRWSQAGNGEATINLALRWLGDWCERFPDKQFIFLLGNHDAHAPFGEALRQRFADHPKFFGGVDSVRIRDTLFVHGDVIEGDGSAQAFDQYRERWSNKPEAGPLQHRAYDAAVAARLHRAVATAAHRKRRTCLRLLRWMHRQPHDRVQGVRQIVFGHTHRQIHGLWVDGVRFYNGGATIRHVPFSPVKIEFEESLPDHLH